MTNKKPRHQTYRVNTKWIEKPWYCKIYRAKKETKIINFVLAKLYSEIKKNHPLKNLTKGIDQETKTRVFQQIER